MSDRDIDQQLVERVQQGEKKAFDLLAVKYQGRLTRLLSRLIRDGADIEDIVQETLIKAYRALPGFRGESAFYTWLYRIGLNTAKNFLSHKKKQPSANLETEYSEGNDDIIGTQLADLNTPETDLLNKEIVKTVNMAVNALPEELKTAITLREMDGLSYEDIAKVMACPIGTVRSRIFRAREAIATQLKPLLDSAHNDRW